ncbi:MAG: FHA domain-containing protein [Alphaproteobacteria bacterium]|nr:FHA domain-containing protein [Alphaproteobacteria bacterium]
MDRRLAAILHADVVGYSRLMEGAETRTFRELKTLFDGVWLPALGRHSGRLVNTAGDAMLVEFGSAVAAVRCAMELQVSMSERNANRPPERHVTLRIGLNIGEVIVDGDNIFGDEVNLAARIQALAEPGTVVVSARVREAVEGKVAFGFDDLGDHSVKNISRPVRVHRVLPAAAGAEETILPVRAAAPPLPMPPTPMRAPPAGSALADRLGADPRSPYGAPSVPPTPMPQYPPPQPTAPPIAPAQPYMTPPAPTYPPAASPGYPPLQQPPAYPPMQQPAAPSYPPMQQPVAPSYPPMQQPTPSAYPPAPYPAPTGYPPAQQPAPGGYPPAQQPGYPPPQPPPTYPPQPAAPEFQSWSEPATQNMPPQFMSAPLPAPAWRLAGSDRAGAPVDMRLEPGLLEQTEGVVFGRLPRYCHLTFDNDSLSRRHARFRAAPDGTLTVEDLGSTNGTAVDGQRIEAFRPVPLRDGSRLSLGEIKVVVSKA